MTEQVTLHLAQCIRGACDIRDGLSGARLVGDALFLACDEAAEIERLSLQADGSFGDHAFFPLADLVELPGRRDDEVDIEGLAHGDGALWVLGSHSRKRKKPKAGGDDADGLKRLARIKCEPNRFLLARLPLVETDGALRPVREGAARLAGDGAGNILTHALSEDAHVAPFLRLPAKENGLDLEGMAVLDDGRVLIGMRGPVLRGRASVLEIRPVVTAPGVLGLAPFDDGRLIRKHVLDLDGLGLRDLCMDGDDVLLLAGPTMDLPGPFRLHRWIGGPEAGDGDRLVRAERLPLLRALPHEQKPEGVTRLADGRLLIVYDQPDDARKPAAGTLLADVVRLAPEGSRTA